MRSSNSAMRLVASACVSMSVSRCANSACTRRFIIIRAKCGINAIRNASGPLAARSAAESGCINSMPPATGELGSATLVPPEKESAMEYGGTTIRSAQFVQETTPPMPSSVDGKLLATIQATKLDHDSIPVPPW
jgi:hypothetical protein